MSEQYNNLHELLYTKDKMEKRMKKNKEDIIRKMEQRLREKEMDDQIKKRIDSNGNLVTNKNIK